MNKYNAYQAKKAAAPAPNAIVAAIAANESTKPVLKAVATSRPAEAATEEIPATPPIIAPAPETAPAPVESKPDDAVATPEKSA